MNKYHYGMDIAEQGRLEQEQKIERVLDIAKAFTSNASEIGGRLDLEIDRYGHIKLKIEINKREVTP